MTVVTPLFNAAHLITSAIESVRAQSFTDWEMTVVDDGSTDGSTEVVEALAAGSGGRLRCLRQPNKGAGAARNLALRSARTDFIAFLDADDAFLPFRLALSVEMLERNPGAALVHGRALEWFYPDGRVGVGPVHASRLSGRIANALYTRRTSLNCSTITLRRTCLEEVGYFDESLHTTEDRDLWLRIAQRWDVLFVDVPVIICRIRAASLSSDPDRAMQAQLAFVEKNFGGQGCGSVARRRALAGIHLERGNEYFNAGHRDLARQQYLRGLLAHPFENGNAYMILRSLFP